VQIREPLRELLKTRLVRVNIDDKSRSRQGITCPSGAHEFRQAPSFASPPHLRSVLRQRELSSNLPLGQ
jgi:hypothetical protein